MAEDNGEGLTLEEEEFMRLKQKDQMCVLYKNQVATLKLVKGFRFHQKVQYISIALLTGGLGIVLKVIFIH